MELPGLTAGQRTFGISVGRGTDLTFHTVGGPGGGRLAVGPITPPEFDASNSSTLHFPLGKAYHLSGRRLPAG